MASVLDDLEKVIQKGVEENVGQFTDWDDDIAPVLFVVSSNMKIIVFPIPQEFMNSQEGKEILCRVLIPQFANGTKAIALGMVVSSWFVQINDQVRAAYPGVPEQDIGQVIVEQYGSIGDSPWKDEAVCITMASRDEVRGITAMMSREDDGTATLKEWSRSVASDGRFVKAMRTALAESTA
jgi:hypothetical protein